MYPGEGFKYRNKKPKNKEEIIEMFLLEIKLFREWIKQVPKERKKSFFWECDYDEMLYLDILLELIFENFPDLKKIDKHLLDEIIQFQFATKLHRIRSSGFAKI